MDSKPSLTLRALTIRVRARSVSEGQTRSKSNLMPFLTHHWLGLSLALLALLAGAWRIVRQRQAPAGSLLVLFLGLGGLAELSDEASWSLFLVPLVLLLLAFVATVF